MSLRVIKILYLISELSLFSPIVNEFGISSFIIMLLISTQFIEQKITIVG